MFQCLDPMARREVSELSIVHEHDLSTSLHLSRSVDYAVYVYSALNMVATIYIRSDGVSAKPCLGDIRSLPVGKGNLVISRVMIDGSWSF